MDMSVARYVGRAWFEILKASGIEAYQETDVAKGEKLNVVHVGSRFDLDLGPLGGS